MQTCGQFVITKVTGSEGDGVQRPVLLVVQLGLPNVGLVNMSCLTGNKKLNLHALFPNSNKALL